MTVIRGCGTRKAGGLYFEVGLSPFGSALENFIVDPPIAIDCAKFGISPVGQHILDIDGSGAYHIYDWCGAKDYPNVADLLEEGRRHGFSRRANPQADFSKLTEQSLLVFIHPKAYVINWQRYNPTQIVCPKAALGTAVVPDGHATQTRENHDDMCSSVWYQDLVGGVSAGSDRTVVRQLPNPGDSYRGWTRPVGVLPDYTPAIFLAIRPTRMVVVDDPGDPDTVHNRQDAAEASGLTVDIVDE